MHNTKITVAKVYGNITFFLTLSLLVSKTSMLRAGGERFLISAHLPAVPGSQAGVTSDTAHLLFLVHLKKTLGMQNTKI